MVCLKEFRVKKNPTHTPYNAHNHQFGQFTQVNNWKSQKTHAHTKKIQKKIEKKLFKIQINRRDKWDDENVLMFV